MLFPNLFQLQRSAVLAGSVEDARDIYIAVSLGPVTARPVSLSYLQVLG